MAIKLGLIYGVPIYIDYSFFIIFVLIVWSVGYVLMPATYPKLSQFEYFAIGLASAILLFGSILLHELAHSIVAKRNGLRISKITLLLFGGVSEIEGQPDDPNVELWTAAAGPLTSLAIAAICYALWLGSTFLKVSVLIQAPLWYSFLVNAIVAGFNLIPAIPMDGGRILRAALWRYGHDMIKSTQRAATIGRIFAYLIIGAGVVLFLISNLFTGLWFLLIGWFIYSGAGGELRQALIQRDLAGLKAKNLMTRNVDFVTPDSSLTELSAKFNEAKLSGFAVVDASGNLVGYLRAEDLRRVKKETWDATRVSGIMTPVNSSIMVAENEPAMKALQLMNTNRIGRVFVLDDTTGKVSGVITRSDVVRTVQVEESMLRGVPLSQIISVEQGMLFELEVLKEDGADWTPLFNPSEFSLVGQKILQLSDGGQSNQFTFQPLQKGAFFITLSQSSPQPARQGSKGAQKQVRYNIVVN